MLLWNYCSIIGQIWLPLADWQAKITKIQVKEVVFMERALLFENVKFCSICRGALPLDYEDELCPACKENQLFSEVKEYIRAGDVTEYQVAEYFNIPRRLVKKWITEGRIEYKEEEEKLDSLHCAHCGTPITFGHLCQKCYRELNNLERTGFAAFQEGAEDHRMRFLDNEEQ